MKTYKPYAKSIFFLLFNIVFIPGILEAGTSDLVFRLVGITMFTGGAILGLYTRITFHKDFFDTTMVPKAILVDCTNQKETKQVFKYQEIKSISYVNIDKRFTFKREATIHLMNGDQYIFPIHLFTFAQGQEIKKHLDSIK